MPDERYVIDVLVVSSLDSLGEISQCCYTFSSVRRHLDTGIRHVRL